MLSFDVDVEWQEVDRNLRSIAKRRAALDAEEARWLREAERLQIWRPLGMVSALDYMERVLGYTPHAAAERLRVARALESLPQIATALDAGTLAFSAVRELTRVATPETEAEWCKEARGKNVRQIEELVAGHEQGDRPDDPVNPDVRSHTIRFDLPAAVYARLRQARAALTAEAGRYLDDADLIGLMCEAVLERAVDTDGERAPTGRAKFQIMMTECRSCRGAWQEGSGKQIAVDAATLDRAHCDAQWIGSTDDPIPVRAEQDIPPSVVRFVWHRDGGRCQTPGCRSARGLEIHHIRPRSEGGTHDPSNLRLQCSACHAAIHRENLVFDGNTVHRPQEAPAVHAAPTTPSKLDATILRTQACDALTGLGWKANIARTAVEEALSAVGEVTIDALIREALRRCPRPT